MHILFAFVLMLIALPVQAQTPITKAIANEYYQNCLAEEAPTMSRDNKTLMCSCTSAQMMQGMTVEDIQATTSKDRRKARLAMNKLLLVVYAPCIEFPASDYYYNTCVENPNTRKLTRRPQQLCDCLSTEVANFLDQHSVEIFGEILERDPYITDPMAALAGDPDFERFAQNKLLGCVQ